MILQISLPLMMLYAYYQRVDILWLQDQITASMDAHQQEVASRYMTRGFMITSAALVLATLVPVISALLALYFFLVAKAQSAEETYGRWYMLVSWAAVPTLLLVPVGLAVIFLSSDGRLLPDEINPTTLNQLLVHADGSNPWRSLLEGVNPFLFWPIALMAIGFSVWTRIPIGRATLITAAPYTIVFGVWALLITLVSAG